VEWDAEPCGSKPPLLCVCLLLPRLLLECVCSWVQAHFSRLALPVADYVTDTRSVLDQSIRVLQAMVDVAAHGGWLPTTLHVMHTLQMVLQVNRNGHLLRSCEAVPCCGGGLPYEARGTLQTRLLSCLTRSASPWSR
jgi:hypothetical protein